MTRWPPKYKVLGVPISVTSYAEAADLVIAASRRGDSIVMNHMPVDGVIKASRSEELLEIAYTCEIVAPDGQPVRWALNLLHGAGLDERVYGPQMMRRLCQDAASAGLSVYLIGATPPVRRSLERRLQAAYPELRIAGGESPPFCPVAEMDLEEIAQRVNASQAEIVFLGLGCPKQERFADAFREHIDAVQVCVGAAFDFLAGYKPTAPSWMQDIGLEWMFRLLSEPRRLWRRYLIGNSLFVTGCVATLLKRGLFNRD